MSTEYSSGLRPGLVSVTFRQWHPEDIIALCREVSLQGIEWSADFHVPCGDLAKARQVRRWCQDAGLQTAAYGSYYYTGHSEEKHSFEQVLETAQELGAPLIRAWAGKLDAQDADEMYFRNIVAKSQRMGYLANQANIKLAYEFHGKTLNNNANASNNLLDAIGLSPWQTLWQPLTTETLPQTESLKTVLPRLANLHVYHWRNYQNRFALAAGEDEWKKYFSIADNGVSRWALLEFVRHDDPVCLREDASVLHRLLPVT